MSSAIRPASDSAKAFLRQLNCDTVNAAIEFVKDREVFVVFRCYGTVLASRWIRLDDEDWVVDLACAA